MRPIVPSSGTITTITSALEAAKLVARLPARPALRLWPVRIPRTG
ncbi:MAG TPA: hypothetical protein VNT56_09015 [Acidimicrobiales bacterium]|nr:hypothetical protein [Acidimicrobiales bacterium]